ncbi:unnamed protein product [Vicia faba]|uniref:Uncharacterized protein n=1 Tax=Vicia faba TaxID=3906 RepID=A0AAV0ZCQ5_VICFA|nr:unnamed protein product [Vicia faba]
MAKKSNKGKKSMPSSSAGFDNLKFSSGPHQHRYDSLGERNIIDERKFDLQRGEYTDVYATLKKYRLTTFNNSIQPVSSELVNEFFENSYRVSQDAPKFISYVRGKIIEFDWKMIDKLLKLKFKEL